MSLSINPQWHFLAALAAVVVVGLRAGTILDHQHLSKGTETVTGRVDDVQASRRIRVIRYSYEVAGKKYTGETTGRTGFLEGVPTTVTYAKSKPSVSTLQPEELGSKYRNSLIISAIAVLPMFWMWLLELSRLRKRKVPEPAGSV